MILAIGGKPGQRVRQLRRGLPCLQDPAFEACRLHHIRRQIALAACGPDWKAFQHPRDGERDAAMARRIGKSRRAVPGEKRCRKADRPGPDLPRIALKIAGRWHGIVIKVEGAAIENSQ